MRAGAYATAMAVAVVGGLAIAAHVAGRETHAPRAAALQGFHFDAPVVTVPTAPIDPDAGPPRYVPPVEPGIDRSLDPIPTATAVPMPQQPQAFDVTPDGGMGAHVSAARCGDITFQWHGRTVRNVKGGMCNPCVRGCIAIETDEGDSFGIDPDMGPILRCIIGACDRTGTTTQAWHAGQEL